MHLIDENPGSRHGDAETHRYSAFWHRLGATFPSLKGAPSTAYYLECEQIVWDQYFPPLRDRLLLKTDLWNEAKGTEILRWAAARGARTIGVDIAFGTVSQARSAFHAPRSALLVSDIRQLPFRSDSFDLVYSMGTIEHFTDYDVAVRELWRVLKPCGIAIIGVPNKLDPFLRPLLVWVLTALRLYAYGLEKSFTPHELRRLLQAAGFAVKAETGLLFLPGWLRLLDLWCHTRARRLTAVTGPFVKPFAWLYRRLPAIRRQGYLIACVAEKPAR